MYPPPHMTHMYPPPHMPHGAGGAPDVKLALPTLSSLKRDATSLDPVVAAADQDVLVEEGDET